MIVKESARALNPLAVMLSSLKHWAKQLKTDIHALYLASSDSRLPWHIKLLAVCVVAYALSPIDLIPDFIPVLGYLDDFLLLPLGIWLVLRSLPPDLLAEYRAEAQTWGDRPSPRNGVATAVILGIWLALGVGLGVLASRWLGK